jgi:hypothetical protein
LSAALEPAPALPRPVRNAAIGCLLLCGAIGFGSANALGELVDPERNAETARRAAPVGFGDPERDAAMREAYLKMVDVRMSALVGMRGSRLVIVSALAAACAVALVSALRLLRPGPFSRDGQRKLLGGAALVAAVLRTLDGAQLTSVAGRMGATVDAVMGGADWPSGLAAFLSTAFTIGFTVVMAGGLLVLSHYFRSEKVKQIVAFADRRP